MPTYVDCHIVCCTGALYASCGKQIFSCICTHIQFAFAHAQQDIMPHHGQPTKMIDRRSAAAGAQQIQTPWARATDWYKGRTINK